MTEQQIELNAFLVNVFNDILRLEEASLRSTCRNLSVSELHVLEAIDTCEAAQACSMAEIAARLGITSGTLTVAVKTLEQKGFLTRNPHPSDKRRVVVSLTQAATPVLAGHKQFHAHLVQQVTQRLTEAQAEMLISALRGLHTFFTTMEP